MTSKGADKMISARAEQLFTMKNPRRLLRILIAVATLTQWGALSAQGTTYVGSSRIAVYVPEGFCELGGSPPEMERKRLVQEDLGGTRELLSMFAPCDELKKFAAGEIIAFRRWGTIELPRVNGAYYPAPSRRSLLEQAMAQTAEDPADVLARLERRLQRQIREKVPIEPIQSGILALDAATYQGSIVSVKVHDGDIGTVVGVGGMTATKGVAVAYNMFELADTASSFERLLRRHRQLIAKFLAVNE